MILLHANFPDPTSKSNYRDWFHGFYDPAVSHARELEFSRPGSGYRITTDELTLALDDEEGFIKVGGLFYSRHLNSLGWKASLSHTAKSEFLATKAFIPLFSLAPLIDNTGKGIKELLINFARASIDGLKAKFKWSKLESSVSVSVFLSMLMDRLSISSSTSLKDSVWRPLFLDELSPFYYNKVMTGFKCTIHNADPVGLIFDHHPPMDSKSDRKALMRGYFSLNSPAFDEHRFDAMMVAVTAHQLLEIDEGAYITATGGLLADDTHEHMIRQVLHKSLEKKVVEVQQSLSTPVDMKFAGSKGLQQARLDIPLPYLEVVKTMGHLV